MTNTSERPLLKELLGWNAIEQIAAAGTLASADFRRDAFLEAARKDLACLSIMERVRHIADALALALPSGFPDALAIVRSMGGPALQGFQAVALAEFIARFGLDAFDRSMEALADLTRYGSAEFAIRPFLAAEPQRTLAVMLKWAGNDDEHIRRLASEGSRPRLPWAARVPALKADPTLTAPILEVLKADPSPYVRKSVANHINDITRERPNWALDLLERWRSDDPATVWITKHALRTLIKNGEPRALALIGATVGAEVDVRNFTVTPAELVLDEAITLSAELVSLAAQDQRLVVDYRITYARASGRTSAKVFKLKTFSLPKGGRRTVGIRQPIQNFSTRRHHPGRHEVELVINGMVAASAAFELHL